MSERYPVGKKHCGNPQCSNEIVFYNHVSFQNALKHRPNSLCPQCRGRKSVETRKSKVANMIKEVGSKTG